MEQHPLGCRTLGILGSDRLALLEVPTGPAWYYYSTCVPECEAEVTMGLVRLSEYSQHYWKDRGPRC